MVCCQPNTTNVVSAVSYSLNASRSPPSCSSRAMKWSVCSSGLLRIAQCTQQCFPRPEQVHLATRFSPPAATFCLRGKIRCARSLWRYECSWRRYRWSNATPGPALAIAPSWYPPSGKTFALRSDLNKPSICPSATCAPVGSCFC